MTPYTIFRNGSITSLSETSTSTSSTPAGYRSLICAAPPYLKGDFKRPNEWSYTVIDSSVSYGTSQMYIDGKWSTTSYGYFTSEANAWADVAIHESHAYDQALSRLVESMRGSLDLSIAAAESKQTIRMVNLVNRYTQSISRMKGMFVKDIYREFRAARAYTRQRHVLISFQKKVKKFPYARRSYKPVPVNRALVSRVSSLGANGWLEFTYGWKPLVSDIKAVADNIVGRVNGSTQVLRASGKINVDQRRVTPASPYSPPTRETASGFVGCKIIVRSNGGFDPGLSRYTSLNPLSVAWELTPYSFVLDWFFDLGSYMRNLESSMIFSSNFMYGSISYLSVMSYSLSHVGKTPDALNYYVQHSNAVKKVTSFRRVTSVSFPTPEVPKFNLDLGSSRLLSAASLLRQLIK